MSVDITHYKVEARATIEGLGDIEVTRLSVTYALNQIPTGSITLALGRDAVTGVIAPIHNQAEQLHNKLKTEIFLTIGNTERKIFDGFTAGAPYKKNYDSAAFSVGVVGWMDDLRNSSAMSSIFAVGTPSDFFATASSSIAGAALFASSASGDALIPFNVEADVWNAIKRALVILCTKGLFTSSGDDAANEGGTTRPIDDAANNTAVAALDRFIGDVLPLATISSRLANSIALHIGDAIFRAEGGATVWSIILSLAGQYGFSIVPLVEGAKAVAHVPFLKSELITKEIKASEYESLSRSAYSRNQIRGAILLGAGASITGVIDGVAKKQSKTTARYLVKDDGLIFASYAPRWLSGDVSTETWTPKTTGVGGNGVRSTGVSSGGSSGETENENFNDAKERDTIGERYAQYVYLLNALAGRNVTLSGKVRFDIGPGTPVMVETGGTDLYEDKKYMYGNVASVTISAETRSPRVATVFIIDNYHVKSENDTAADGHPIFGEAYLGDPLVEE